MENAIEALKATDSALLQQAVGGHCKSFSRTDFHGPWQLNSFLLLQGYPEARPLPFHSARLRIIPWTPDAISFFHYPNVDVNSALPEMPLSSLGNWRGRGAALIGGLRPGFLFPRSSRRERCCCYHLPLLKGPRGPMRSLHHARTQNPEPRRRDSY